MKYFLKRFWKILGIILLLLLFFLITCKVRASRTLPTPFPTPPIIKAEHQLYFPLALNEYPIAYGSASGQFISIDTQVPVDAGLIVWFGRVYCDHKGEGCIFIIDTARSPAGLTNDNGKYWIDNIPSGRYVIVISVGEFTGGYDIVSESGRPIVWRIYPETHLNTGIIETWLDKNIIGQTIKQISEIFIWRLNEN